MSDPEGMAKQERQRRDRSRRVVVLIVAIILQLFYNYLISKIDGLVNQMEDASISLVDILVKHNLSK